jgi:putative mRNA 3-end processing factor
MDLLVETPAGLRCEAGGFHLDPVKPVERAVVTHAHADHARPGSESYLCAAPALGLLRRRLGAEARIQTLAYGETLRLGEIALSLHPAGHLLGSAQVRLERGGEVWVASGDYKREADPTCAPFEPLRCHAFLTEATYALPIYRWDAPGAVAREVLQWWDAGRAAGRASVLYCWILGKAQRLLAELAALTDREVWVHGAMEPFNMLYREAGVRLLPTRLVRETEKGASFAGQLVLAPLTARGTPWARRMGAHESAFASGEMRIRGRRRRRSFDRGFALSDHADWPGVLRTVRETGAERIFVSHGHREALARALREQGLDARALQAGLGAEPSEEGD